MLPQLKLELIEYSIDESLNSFLAEKSLQLRTIQANASIILSQIFEDVKQELGRKKGEDGIYIEWLEDNGFNKMTALRHRNRYNIFEASGNKEGKLMVATLPIRIIQSIAKLEDKEEIVEKIDLGATKKEIEEFLIRDILEVEEPKKEKPIRVNFIMSEKKIKGVKTKEEISNCLEEINNMKRLLGRNEEILKNK